MQFKSITAIAVLLLIVVSLLVAGCTQNATDGGGGGDAAGVAVKINSVNTYSKLGSGNLVSTPRAGYKYVVLNVTVTNLNKNDFAMGNLLYFKLSTNDGTAYSYSLSTFNTNKEIEMVLHTNAGEKVTGEVAFEIPQSATPKQLTYNDTVNQVTTNL